MAQGCVGAQKTFIDGGNFVKKDKSQKIAIRFVLIKAERPKIKLLS